MEACNYLINQFKGDYIPPKADIVMMMKVKIRIKNLTKTNQQILVMAIDKSRF